MLFRDLREFIGHLETHGQLKHISTPVSRDLEITEVTSRVSKGPREHNKALLFEHVEGFDIPVAINLFGSQWRMAAALGVENLEALNHRLAKLLDFRMPEGVGSVVARGMDVLGALKSVGVGPSVSRSGPCQQVVVRENPNVNMLPVLQCWPDDGGRFITLVQVITCDPESGARNVGMYRLQLLDDRRLAMHWQRHKGGAEHERRACAAAQRIPAAAVLGGDPASMWAASAPLPPDIDEYLLAGWLRGKPVQFVQCVSQPLQVPAQAEFILEGYVDPQDQVSEGMFGDHTGYYTPVESFPAFHLTAITHRRDPIYPSTVVGIPPMEDTFMGLATERLFLPLLRIFLPEVIDYHMPPEGVFHNLVIVKIRKRYPGHARKVMYGIWGLGLLMLAKAIVVVDEWVDIHDPAQVAWQALGNVDWKRDALLVEGPVDHLDHAASAHSFGGKIGIDATAKGPRDGHPRGWPEVARMSAEIERLVDEKWEEYDLG